jgi:hypothetical protein
VVVAAKEGRGVRDVDLPGAVFVGIIEYGHVFPENLLALLAGHHDLGVLEDFVVLALGVALGAVEPEFAALGPDLHLRVQNVFAHNSNY